MNASLSKKVQQAKKRLAQDRDQIRRHLANFTELRDDLEAIVESLEEAAEHIDTAHIEFDQAIDAMSKYV